ncbi:hypothetical protein IT570_10165 [Candidatus Sumerlaeota bacterium]|nr:hypothetical protein [Candidatus Sumerlaeota bacterium]
MMRAPSTTLYIHPASHSPLALVIRRGPSKWWHFLLWDRDTGIITPGSWFNGMIYPHRCDLSPRGNWMLLLAGNATNDPCAWTAVCQPPNVKAICFFPQSHAKNGGGFFDARQPIVWLNRMENTAEQEDFSKHGFEIGYQEKNQPPYGSFSDRLERDGWKHHGAAKKQADESVQMPWVKKSPLKNYELLMEVDACVAPTEMDEQCAGGERVRYFVRSVGSKDQVPVKDVQWANWNKRGELCMASDGCLYHARVEHMNEHRRLVVDLNKLAPRIRKEKVAAAEDRV